MFQLRFVQNSDICLLLMVQFQFVVFCLNFHQCLKKEIYFIYTLQKRWNYGFWELFRWRMSWVHQNRVRSVGIYIQNGNSVCVCVNLYIPWTNTSSSSYNANPHHVCVCLRVHFGAAYVKLLFTTTAWTWLKTVVLRKLSRASRITHKNAEIMA